MDNVRQFFLGQFKALRPSLLSKKPHFNFITAHYVWILFLSILGSILVYSVGGGNLAYVDALFFATGANTQAGLNTVDVNNLNTAQQVLLYFFPMLSNPITVNSFVVFLRLYWFEKRFQHVVREARQRRGTMSKSKAKAQDDTGLAERGVNGRNITVMHNGQRSRITNDGILIVEPNEKPVSDNAYASENGHAKGASTSSDDDELFVTGAVTEARRPEITFATTVKRSDGIADGATKHAPNATDAEHIAILERQRQTETDDGEVLRIPGPREAERGALPSRIVLGDTNELETTVTRQVGETDLNGLVRPRTGEPRPQTITIAEPARKRQSDSSSEDFVENARLAARVFTFLKLRKPRKATQKLHADSDEFRVRTMTRRRTLDTIRTAFSRDKDDMAPYLSWEPTLGRNSAFPDLTEEQREELGGIEYRSLKTLALILTCYFWGFTVFGVIILVPWILRTDRYGEVVDNVAQNRVWWGIFSANSAFMDMGFTLTPDSMNSFNTAVLPMILLSFLIIIGNTGFPVMLRLMIWISSLFTPRGSGLWEELRFLLDHPRRCFTLLFPSGATWWLFWLLVILNGLDLVFFIILDLGPSVVSDLPPGIRVLDGLFQAASTRTAGFSCVNLALLHPGVQVSYLLMMYISVFPIAISVRRTNVYEEKSLGIYSKNEIDDQANSSGMSYVGAHLRRQLSFDLWYIFIGLFILSISEGSRLMSNDITMFAVLFEIVSAYGTVGMSLGYSTVNASLSSQFSVVGKLVIIAMMVRGRHRGLPYGLDRAILLPSESLLSKEAEDADARMVRQSSRVSVATNRTRAGRSRSRSVDHRNNNLLTSLLHPGPAVPPDSVAAGLRRRSSDPGSEDDNSYSARTVPRRAETATH